VKKVKIQFCLANLIPRFLCAWVYRDCALALPVSTTLHHGSTRLYVALLHSTMAPLGSTCLYPTPPWLYAALCGSTTLHHGSTWLYLSLLHSTMWLYWTVLHSTMALYFVLLCCTW